MNLVVVYAIDPKILAIIASIRSSAELVLNLRPIVAYIAPESIPASTSPATLPATSSRARENKTIVKSATMNAAIVVCFNHLAPL